MSKKPQYDPEEITPPNGASLALVLFLTFAVL